MFHLMCVECEKEAPVTNDGRLCKGCLKNILDNQSFRYSSRTLNQRGTEAIGRKHIDSKVLGGAPVSPDCLDIEDETDDNNYTGRIFDH